MTELKHHELGFSSLRRRANCPLSLTLERECKNDPEIEADNKDADEGSFLHEKAWDDRTGLTDEQSYLMRVIDTELDRLATLHGIEEWIGEKTLGIHVDGAEYSFGTPDLYGLFTDDQGLKAAVLADFKFGRDPVEHPKINLQIKAGSLALHQAFDLDYAIGVIIQPRVRSKDHPATKFTKFDSILIELLEIRDACLGPNPGRRSGDWCKYCKAMKARCPVMREVEGQLATTRLDAITPANAEELYAKAMLVEKRVKSIKAHCKQLTVEAGGELGRLSIQTAKGARSVDDIQAFYESIQEHIEIADFLALCKVDLTKLEKAISGALVDGGEIKFKKEARDWLDGRNNVVTGPPKKSIKFNNAK